MSDPNDRYAGLTDEERAFAEGLGAEGEVVDIGDLPAEQDNGQPVSEQQQDVAQGVDSAETGAQPAAQDDPLAALPEDLRNRFVELESAQRTLAGELEKAQAREAQLRNDNAAMAGRLKPLQHRLAELERPSTPDPKEPPPQSAEDLAALFETEDFAEFERMYPTEAKLQKEKILGAVGLTERRLQAEIARLTQRIEQVSPVIEKFRERTEEAEWQKKVDALAAVHPDFQEIDAKPEFWGWFNGEYAQNLPPPIRRQLSDPEFRKDLFADPDSVSTILTQYKARTPAAPAAAAPAQSAPAAKAVDPRLALSVAPNVGSSATRAVNISALPPEEQFLAGLNS